MKPRFDFVHVRAVGTNDREAVQSGVDYGKFRFVDQAGDIDIWAPVEPWATFLMVVCDPAVAVEKNSPFNYSSWRYDKDTGTLYPSDTDVHIEPYHMCRMHEILRERKD